MNGGSRVDWTNLPLHIYPLIAERLKTHLELLRFRSVCTFWRSSIPPITASPPLNFPIPGSSGPTGFLSQITVYLVRPYRNTDPSTSPSPSPSPSPKAWLLKVEECAGKLRLLNPITSWRIRSLNDDVPVNPSDFNLLDFNMVELTKSYSLRYTKGSGPIFGINKVILAPNFKHSSVFIIYDAGKLGFAQIGDHKLTLINDQISDYDDLIVFKGHPHVVNRCGQVFRIDSCLKLIPFSSTPIGFGHRKSLIECHEELYMVDSYIDYQMPQEEDIFFLRSPSRRRRKFYESRQPKAVDFKVYKLVELDGGDMGGGWVEVKSLGSEAFFLGIDGSFSVLGSELEGCNGNCIYFTDANDVGLALRELTRADGSVFSLEDHSIERIGSSPFYSKMFWPLQS